MATASAATANRDVAETLAGISIKAPSSEQGSKAYLAGGEAPPSVGQPGETDLADLIEITRGTETVTAQAGIDVVELAPLETGGSWAPTAAATDTNAGASLDNRRPAWGVQVGAYRDFALAQLAALQATRQVPEILSASKAVVSQVMGDEGQLYRARLTGLTETRAREACRQLKTLNQGCLVIPPERLASELSEAG
jgi:hypothetical protein